VRLGDVARIFSGSPAPQDKRYFEEGSMPFVRVQDLGRYGITTNLTETSDKVNGEAVKELRLVKANKGTILFPKSGAAILTNSRAILGEDAYIVSHLAAVEPFHDVLETLWAFYWLCTVDMGRYIDNPAYPSLRLSKIRELLIPLPPLEEQRRIVARVEELMSRIREAKRLRQEAKEEAERLWQSILSETFPKPGSELPKGWRWVRLGDVCEYRTGIWGPEASDPTQGFPIIRSTEIEGLLIRPQTASVRMVRRGQVDAYKLETGDILINKSSGSPHLVGWPAIFEDPRDGKIYLFSNFMLRLRADRRTLEPWFLLYYLHSPTARSIYLGAQDTTSGLRNLRVREFMVQPIPLPPLEEQRCIVAYFQDVQEKSEP
jgi:type I restriction enzyme S subunit